MTDRGAGGDRRVVAVTGGGGGIGAAIAEELGRQGWFVVTMDPLVSIDGAEQLPAPRETTATRIVAAGGAARATSVSVTDRDGVQDVFVGLVDELGRLDAVINVAGITRPSSFVAGTDDDWRTVLTVHLEGYRNVLDAALALMASAGHGHILGVTSGSGWRPADAGAYGCAKRAVASLTWQLGRHAPPGVTVNAMSPIAATRMVTAALGRARPAGARSSPTATGGLSLGSMPTADQLGPLGAHLVSEDFAWCNGALIFAGGSEVAVIEPPRLLEVVRTDGVEPLAPLLERVIAEALVPAEAAQATNGASNPRFGSFVDEPAPVAEPTTGAAADPATCAVVSDRPQLAEALTAALAARSVTARAVAIGDGPDRFAATVDALGAAAADGDPFDAVIVALAGTTPSSGAVDGWARIVDEHADIVDAIHTDAAWARAVADVAISADRPLRLVTLTEAVTAGGRSRAQASAQLARAARKATNGLVTAFAVSLEADDPGDLPAIGELAAHLVCAEGSLGLSGAELVAGAGWFGLRSHPRPLGSIVLGGSAVPPWLDDTLQEMIGVGRPADQLASERDRS